MISFAPTGLLSVSPKHWFHAIHACIPLAVSPLTTLCAHHLGRLISFHTSICQQSLPLVEAGLSKLLQRAHMGPSAYLETDYSLLEGKVVLRNAIPGDLFYANKASKMNKCYRSGRLCSVVIADWRKAYKYFTVLWEYWTVSLPHSLAMICPWYSEQKLQWDKYFVKSGFSSITLLYLYNERSDGNAFAKLTFRKLAIALRSALQKVVPREDF